jgi:hypothetical protein
MSKARRFVNKDTVAGRNCYIVQMKIRETCICNIRWAASMAGVKCCTVITNTASKVKVESVEAHGAEIVYCDPTPLSR